MTNRYLDGERPAPRAGGGVAARPRAGPTRSGCYGERLEALPAPRRAGGAVGVRRRREQGRRRRAAVGPRQGRQGRRRGRGRAPPRRPRRPARGVPARRPGGRAVHARRRRRGSSPSSATTTPYGPDGNGGPPLARRAGLGRARRRGRPRGRARSRSSRGSMSRRPSRRGTAGRVTARSAVRLVDSHCHVNADRFDDDADAVLDGGARPAGVERILVPGWNVASSERALDLVDARPVARRRGRRPSRTTPPRSTTPAGRGSSSWPRDPEVVAIGETGLDYDRVFSPIADQLTNLRRNLALAARRPASRSSSTAGRRRAGATPRTRSSRSCGPIGERRPPAPRHPLVLRARRLRRGRCSTSGPSCQLLRPRLPARRGGQRRRSRRQRPLGSRARRDRFAVPLAARRAALAQRARVGARHSGVARRPRKASTRSALGDALVATYDRTFRGGEPAGAAGFRGTLPPWRTRPAALRRWPSSLLVVLAACTPATVSPSVPPPSLSRAPSPVASIVPSAAPSAPPSASPVVTAAPSVEPSAAAACPVEPQTGQLPSDRLVDVVVTETADADLVTFVFGASSIGESPAGPPQGTLEAVEPPYTEAASGLEIDDDAASTSSRCGSSTCPWPTTSASSTTRARWSCGRTCRPSRTSSTTTCPRASSAGSSAGTDPGCVTLATQGMEVTVAVGTRARERGLRIRVDSRAAVR